jgi:hypothetical protein
MIKAADVTASVFCRSSNTKAPTMPYNSFEDQEAEMTEEADDEVASDRHVGPAAVSGRFR